MPKVKESMSVALLITLFETKIMGLFSSIFKKQADKSKAGGMEDYMTLVRVYFQATLAANLGITNLAMLPDLRT